MSRKKPNKKNASRKKIQQDPRLARQRENNSEFGSAGLAGTLIRGAFRAMINVTTVPSRSLVGNMQKRLMQVIKSDITSDRGSRTIAKGDLSIMNNYQFNHLAPLHKIFYAHFTASTDRSSGKLIVQMPAFVPSLSMTSPSGTTHFQLVTAAAEFNFDKQEFKRNETRSGELPLDLIKTQPLTLEISISTPSKLAFLHVLAIEFFQKVNGRMYILRENTRSAIGVIQAESAV